ncbi:DNA-binding protein [Radiomyces spectabilis]|uniref:DNA-binding protein n=1 Tax=Radiomyces spectabilis TaxID=64574 RepID=UPI00221F450E|nr:DNA-binding protein [Radiomyces spectabilis]KAI8387978.1 DNA-binding protein [Radiomyces spectabilis]
MSHPTWHCGKNGFFALRSRSMKSSQTVRHDIVNLLCDFLQVWIHQILYRRQLYPHGIFVLRKKYSVPVYMSNNPEVNQYIAQFVLTLRPMLEKGDCKSVSVVVTTATQRPLERFVLEIDSIIRTLDVPLDKLLASEATEPLADFEQYLRACLLKMAACDTILQRNPPHCRFWFSIEMTDEGPPSGQGTGPDVDWIPAEPDVSSDAFAWANLIPLKTIPMDLFKINTYVLEASKKGKQAALD